ncbi:hypothetical protein BDY21DRAFT_337765 [Lineolata rhizophorae]|uniref:Uncharacterized protein n=1 Tax=Lineolata rhizophorae TaxID=578093 RepID=A0A6A6P8C1_9PEZI|nr:hypothetical protein BDY21DRAFT_337765 [Lineolata rhizophorae]
MDSAKDKYDELAQVARHLVEGFQSLAVATVGIIVSARHQGLRDWENLRELAPKLFDSIHENESSDPSPLPILPEVDMLAIWLQELYKPNNPDEYGVGRAIRRANQALKSYRQFVERTSPSVPHNSSTQQPPPVTSPSVSPKSGTKCRAKADHFAIDFTVPGTPGKLGCPFATMKASRAADNSAINTSSSVSPPRARWQGSHVGNASNGGRRSKRPSFVDPIKAEVCHNDAHNPDAALMSPTAAVSVDGGAAGTNNNDVASDAAAGGTPAPICPIRFLDQHSPEEMAQYFEKHKHELPRSHAVCVRRYQRNEESIRQLDAKYGNLVSMIQGLGEQHRRFMSEKLEGSEDHEDGEAEGNEHGVIDENQEGVSDAAADDGLGDAGGAPSGRNVPMQGDEERTKEEILREAALESRVEEEEMEHQRRKAEKVKNWAHAVSVETVPSAASEAATPPPTAPPEDNRSKVGGVGAGQSNPNVSPGSPTQNRSSTFTASGGQPDDSNDDDDRVPHFDRHLKEIRVGESPSRPWGIVVPARFHQTPSATQEDEEDGEEPAVPPPSPPKTAATHTGGEQMGGGLPTSSPDEAVKVRRDCPVAQGTPGPSLMIRGARTGGRCPFGHDALGQGASQHVPPPPTSPGRTRSRSRNEPERNEPVVMPDVEGVRERQGPQMMFTGPVFIGYPVEQAVTLLKEGGWGGGMGMGKM